MALNLMLSVGGLGEFERCFASLRIGVSVSDGELPAHLAHPTIEISLPLLDGENVQQAQREAEETVRRLIDAQALSDWIEKRRLAPDLLPTQQPT